MTPREVDVWSWAEGAQVAGEPAEAWSLALT